MNILTKRKKKEAKKKEKITTTITIFLSTFFRTRHTFDYEIKYFLYTFLNAT